jgi:hypothetical protein
MLKHKALAVNARRMLDLDLTLTCEQNRIAFQVSRTDEARMKLR